MMDDKALQAWKERIAHEHAYRDMPPPSGTDHGWVEKRSFKAGLSAGEQVFRLIGRIELLSQLIDSSRKQLQRPGWYAGELKRCEAQLAEILGGE